MTAAFSHPPQRPDPPTIDAVAIFILAAAALTFVLKDALLRLSG